MIRSCLTSQILRDGVWPGPPCWRQRSVRLTGRVEVSSRRLRGWGDVTHPARFQGSLTGFIRLPAAFNRGSDLNREPQPSLDTITGNVATLATRPPRRRSTPVFGAILKWQSLRKRVKENFFRNRDSNPRTSDQGGGYADHSTTELCCNKVSI